MVVEAVVVVVVWVVVVGVVTVVVGQPWASASFSI